jgi:hypothetical protein
MNQPRQVLAGRQSFILFLKYDAEFNLKCVDFISVMYEYIDHWSMLFNKIKVIWDEDSKTKVNKWLHAVWIWLTYTFKYIKGYLFANVSRRNARVLS